MQKRANQHRLAGCPDRGWKRPWATSEAPSPARPDAVIGFATAAISEASDSNLPTLCLWPSKQEGPPKSRGVPGSPALIALGVTLLTHPSGSGRKSRHAASAGRPLAVSSSCRNAFRSDSSAVTHPEDDVSCPAPGASTSRRIAVRPAGFMTRVDFDPVPTGFTVLPRWNAAAEAPFTDVGGNAPWVLFRCRIPPCQVRIAVAAHDPNGSIRSSIPVKRVAWMGLEALTTGEVQPRIGSANIPVGAPEFGVGLNRGGPDSDAARGIPSFSRSKALNFAGPILGAGDGAEDNASVACRSAMTKTGPAVLRDVGPLHRFMVGSVRPEASSGCGSHPPVLCHEQLVRRHCMLLVLRVPADTIPRPSAAPSAAEQVVIECPSQTGFGSRHGSRVQRNRGHVIFQIGTGRCAPAGFAGCGCLDATGPDAWARLN